MSPQVQIVDDGDGPYFAFFDGTHTVKVNVDFSERYKIGGKADLLVKALGLKEHRKKNKKPLQVVDATAGLCRDTYHFYLLGCEVLAIEQSPIVYEVMSYYFSKKNDERLKLIHADAISYLQDLPADEKPDVVYLDPMFPEKTKSAKAGKESQLLQKIAAMPTPDQEVALLNAALQAAKSRVVVKRPLRAPALAVDKQTLHKPIEVLGRAVRFDIYLVSSRR